MRLFLILFLIHNLVFSQDLSAKHQLLSQLDSITKTEAKVQLYADIAWEYIMEENDSALIFADRALKISQQNSYPFGEVIALETKGIYHELVEGNYDLASQYYFEGIDISSAQNLNYEASIFHALGLMFATSDNYEKSLEYYNKSLNLAKKNEDVILQKMCLINLGATHSSLKDFDKALEFMLASLEIPVRTDLDYATFANLGYLYVKQEKFDIALEFLEKSIEQVPENIDSEIHLYLYIHAKTKAKDSTNMVPILNRAKLAVENVGIRDKSLLLRNIADYYTFIEDFKNALYYRDQYVVVYEEIKEKQRDQTVLDLEAKYQVQEKDFEIERQSNSKKTLTWLLITSLAFLGLITWFFLKIKNKNKLLADQKKLLELSVSQKNILFKEIHHRVKNSLQMVSSLLFLQSQNIDNKEAKNAIKDAQNRVRSLGLIHQKLYSKKHIVGVETKDYITDLTQDIFNSHQLESQNLDYNLEIENLVLNVDTLTPIGLILNELIVNVLKHAFKQDESGNKLNIQFYKEKNVLILKVTDNGIGYNESKIRKKSFGLKLINSLARKLDATFTIKAKTQKGTEANLLIKDFEIIESS